MSHFELLTYSDTTANEYIICRSWCLKMRLASRSNCPTPFTLFRLRVFCTWHSVSCAQRLFPLQDLVSTYVMHPTSPYRTFSDIPVFAERAACERTYERFVLKSIEMSFSVAAREKCTRMTLVNGALLRDLGWSQLAPPILTSVRR